MERAMETLVSRRWNLRIASVVRSMIYFGSFAEPGFLLGGLRGPPYPPCDSRSYGHGAPCTRPAGSRGDPGRTSFEGCTARKGLCTTGRFPEGTSEALRPCHTCWRERECLPEGHSLFSSKRGHPRGEDAAVISRVAGGSESLDRKQEAGRHWVLLEKEVGPPGGFPCPCRRCQILQQP